LYDRILAEAEFAGHGTQAWEWSVIYERNIQVIGTIRAMMLIGSGGAGWRDRDTYRISLTRHGGWRWRIDILLWVDQEL